MESIWDTLKYKEKLQWAPTHAPLAHTYKPNDKSGIEKVLVESRSISKNINYSHG